MPLIWKNKDGTGRIATTITIPSLTSKRRKATVVRAAKEKPNQVWELNGNITRESTLNHSMNNDYPPQEWQHTPTILSFKRLKTSLSYIVKSLSLKQQQKFIVRIQLREM